MHLKNQHTSCVLEHTGYAATSVKAIYVNAAETCILIYILCESSGGFAIIIPEIHSLRAQPCRGFFVLGPRTPTTRVVSARWRTPRAPRIIHEATRARFLLLACSLAAICDSSRERTATPPVYQTVTNPVRGKHWIYRVYSTFLNPLTLSRERR